MPQLDEVQKLTPKAVGQPQARHSIDLISSRPLGFYLELFPSWFVPRRRSRHHNLVPPGLRDPSQHILAVILPKVALQLEKSEGVHTEMNAENEVIYANLEHPRLRKQRNRHKRKGNKYTNGKNMSSSGIEDFTTLQHNQGKYCDIYPGKWSCCEKSCYYLSTEEKTWEQSKKSCQGLESTLIKITGKEEQRFIQLKIKYSYWVGLHKKRGSSVWTWLDGTRPSPELNFQPFTSGLDEKCGHLKPTNIVAALCTREFYYICEKKSSSY
ncbi:C-type lectin domain family 7 member A-like [Sorex araneus]|uniref:C-type lectin domain family 7 member A-like n=1 Tax=Sorex araneus TaxID=42254 RepID=UPI002433C2D5|nr:C-type lectin domain family 7 member A-like [Sorex araneus]